MESASVWIGRSEAGSKPLPPRQQNVVARFEEAELEIGKEFNRLSGSAVQREAKFGLWLQGKVKSIDTMICIEQPDAFEPGRVSEIIRRSPAETFAG